MIPHLTRKCPNISAVERAKIVLRYHGLAVPGVDPFVHPSHRRKTKQGDAEVIEDEDEDEDENEDENETTAQNDSNLNFANPANIHQSNAGPATQNAGQTFDDHRLRVLADVSRRVGQSAQSNDSDHAQPNDNGAQDDSDHFQNPHIPIDPQLNGLGLNQTQAHYGTLSNLSFYTTRGEKN